jgi:hypothetical protein
VEKINHAIPQKHYWVNILFYAFLTMPKQACFRQAKKTGFLSVNFKPTPNNKRLKKQ